MSRTFLTRQQATYALGLACASQMPRASGWVPDDAHARVACLGMDGTIHEAHDGETLHVQIMHRVGDFEMPCGWSVDAAWWLAATSAEAKR